MGTILLLATHNKGKVTELREALTSTNYEVLTLDALGITHDVEEDGDTFEENATKKARYYHQWTGYPTIADDSGLEVDILDGAPGVYSARWTGVHADGRTNCKKLIEELQKKGVHSSPARYVCAMAFADNTSEFVVKGQWEGIVKDTPSGSNGFAYDPCFYVDGISVGDMTLEEKNRYSHRAKAIRSLVKIMLREH